MMTDSGPNVGEFSWHELVTSDINSAKNFYRELLGWSTFDVQVGDTSYTIAKNGDRVVAGMMPLSAQVQGIPPYWGAYVTVNDVDAVAFKAGELGAKILVPPMDIPNIGRFCTLQDPEGAIVSIITYVSGYHEMP
jgi:uncharacterized protein